MTELIKHEIICQRMALSMERGLAVMLSVLAVVVASVLEFVEAADMLPVFADVVVD